MKMRSFFNQYKNLVKVVAVGAAVAVGIATIAAWHTGHFTKLRQNKAAIENQMAIDRAKTEQQIAIIQAETEAELVRIASGTPTPSPGAEGGAAHGQEGA